jgi:type I restriction enzyme, S subunit
MAVRPGYRQTEVGAIPKDWAVDSLRNLAVITTGARNTQDKVEDGQYPFFVRSPEVERINTYSFDGQAVLTAGDGVGTGKVFHYIKGKFDFHQRVYRISNFRVDLDGYFFYLYFSTHFYARIMAMTAKSSVDSVRMEVIAGMRIPLPPLPEQRAIAAAVRDVDALARALDCLIAKKRDLKQAAMQQLLTGRTRLPGFSGKWEVRKLGDVGPLRKGRSIPRSQLSPEGERCVLYGEIYTTYDCVARQLVSFIPKDIAQRSTPVRHGDILFAGSGETADEIGKCFAYVGADQAYAGGDLIILSPANADSIFLGYLLNSRTITRQKASLGQGSSVFHIYVSGLVSVEVPVPALAEQRAIAAVLSDMDAEIAALERRRDKTRALKQGMMHELLTGRIRLI